MTLDIRANIICDLGPVISGGFSDDHMQGTGLVRTRGEIVLSGLISANSGDPLQLAYERNGYVARIPRALRVISSFADPFRRQTTISVGCKFTMLENLRETEETNPAKDPQNAAYDCDVFGSVPLNVSFRYIAEVCLEKLGLTYDGNLLTYMLPGSIAVNSFDFSSGYVSILSDLLYSYSLLGYLDAEERLQIRSLATVGGDTALLIAEDLIDLQPMRSGDMPAETVIVNYSYNRFTPPSEEDLDPDSDERHKRDWELDEQQGELTYVFIPYDGGDSLYSVSYYPLSTIRTKYDLYDRVIRRDETKRVLSQEINGSFFAEFLDTIGSLGESESVAGYYDHYTVEEFVYNDSAVIVPESSEDSTGSGCTDLFKDPGYAQSPSRIIKSTYESDMALVGKLNLPTYIFDDGLLIPGTAPVMIEQTETTFEVDEAEGITKQMVSRRLAYGHTQHGQQMFARVGEDIETSEAALAWLRAAATLIPVGVSISTHVGREFGAQIRPSTTARNTKQYAKDPRASEAKISFITGGAGVGITVSYSLPFAPDDEIYLSGEQWQAVPSNAEQIASTFGSVQQKIAYGHRYGFSAQLTPDKLPPYPGDPVGVNFDVVVGQYLVNGQSWSFDANGIVANVDLVYLGGVGATGGQYAPPQPWAPVQDGITALPPAPEVTTNATPSPANSITTPSNFDATAPDPSIWTALPTNTAAVPAREIPVASVIPAYMEEKFYAFPMKSVLAVSRTFISVPQELTVPLEVVPKLHVVTSYVRQGLTIPVRIALGASQAPGFTLQAGDATPVAGSSITTSTPSGWTQIFNSNNDDTPVASGTFPFTFRYNNTDYTSCFISPNGYITFGSSSLVYSGMSASNPALNKIFINTADDSMQKVYTRSTTNTFRIRVEGNISSSNTGTGYRVFEIAFIRPSIFDNFPVIEVRMGVSPDNTGLFNVYSASAALSTTSATPAADKSWVFLSNNINGTAWTILPSYRVAPVE